jgi:TRAP-type transport system periplasmic protein
MSRTFTTTILCALALMLPQAVSGITLKIATVAPDGTSWMQRLRAGGAEIRERTEGRVILKFYGGGVMGDERAVLRKMRIGQLHGGAFTGGGAALMYPDVRLYSLPLMFRDQAEVDYIRSQMDEEILAGMEEAGYIAFGFASGGFAMVMSQQPVQGIADLEGRKLWIPEGDLVIYESMRALGVSPVTLPLTDVLTGLQTGLIDSVGVSPLGAVAFQWHTQLQHVTDYPLLNLVGTMIVDRRAFRRISDADQAIVREVLGRVYQEFDQENRRDNIRATEALHDQGLEFHPLTDDVESWRQTLAPVFLELASRDVFSLERYQHMLELLEAYRAGLAEAP